MKFMISWQLHQGKLNDALAKFSQMTPEQDAADRGKGVKQIGRWHDLVRGRGVAICESDSAEAVAKAEALAETGRARRLPAVISL